MNGNYWDRCYQERQTSLSKDYDGWLSSHEALIQPGFRVLDLGCGAGTDVDVLLSLGVQLTAADFSADAVRMVREGYGDRIAVDCFDMRDGFPYADAGFDAVVSDLSLHYFSWADTEKIVSELERILASGGKLIARVHSVENMDETVGEKIEENYYIAYGYPRRYFAQEDIRRLFSAWKILSVEAKVARRYGIEKKVIQFVAMKP